MPYNLATNYFGLFLQETSPSGEHLVDNLRAKISSTQRLKSYLTINQILLGIAKDTDPYASFEKSSKASTSLPEVVSSSRQQDAETEIFRGFFPCSALRCRVGKIDWSIAIRASVALAESIHPKTKRKDIRLSLWWSFEGVPDVTSKRPEESDATSYYELTKAMSISAMPELKAAYENAAQQLTSADTVRICLADLDSRPFAELLDSLYLHRRSLSDITDPEPVKGLAELRDYAYQVGKLKLSDSTLKLAEQIPGIKAAFCRDDTFNNPGIHDISIAGFAHPDGLGTALGRPGKSERYVRTMSAARKLSSRLTESEIVEFNQRQLVPHP